MNLKLEVKPGSTYHQANWILVLSHDAFEGSRAKFRYEGSTRYHILGTFESQETARQARRDLLDAMGDFYFHPDQEPKNDQEVS